MASYTEEQRRTAVRAVITMGGYRQAEPVVGIPWETIASWKHRDPAWWDKTFSEISLELLSGLTESSVHKALSLRERLLELIGDRLEHGEHKMNVKTGEVVRVPVSVADMTKTLAALGGVKAEPKPAAVKTDEEILLELAQVAQEDRDSRNRPN